MVAPLRPASLATCNVESCQLMFSQSKYACECSATSAHLTQGRRPAPSIILSGHSKCQHLSLSADLEVRYWRGFSAASVYKPGASK